MKRTIKILVAIAAAITLFATTQVQALTPPARPESGVYDPNNYLTPVVESHLSALNSEGELQVGVVVVKSLEGESIESYANKVARAWEVGYSDTNAGALLVLSIDDRRSRIETSNVTSTQLTDAYVGSLLDQAKEYLRAEEYDNAVISILNGLDAGWSNEEVVGSVNGDVSNPGIATLLFIPLLIGAWLVHEIWLEKKHERRMEEIRRERAQYEGQLPRINAATVLRRSQADEELDTLLDPTLSTASSSVRETKPKTKSTTNRHKNNAGHNHSTWSSSSWGGGGFGGGGASGSW